MQLIEIAIILLANGQDEEAQKIIDGLAPEDKDETYRSFVVRVIGFERSDFGLIPSVGEKPGDPRDFGDDNSRKPGSDKEISKALKYAKQIQNPHIQAEVLQRIWRASTKTSDTSDASVALKNNILQLAKEAAAKAYKSTLTNREKAAELEKAIEFLAKTRQDADMLAEKQRLKQLQEVESLTGWKWLFWTLLVAFSAGAGIAATTFLQETVKQIVAARNAATPRRTRPYVHFRPG